MGKRHTIFIKTDPNSVAQIGIPGQSIFIGSPGQFIYPGNQTDTQPSGLLEFIGLGTLTYTPTTVNVVVEF